MTLNLSINCKPECDCTPKYINLLFTFSNIIGYEIRFHFFQVSSYLLFFFWLEMFNLACSCHPCCQVWCSTSVVANARGYNNALGSCGNIIQVTSQACIHVLIFTYIHTLYTSYIDKIQKELSLS